MLGLVCLVAFSVLQRSCFPLHYRFRLLSPNVTIKPRPLPTKGWSSLWWVLGWGGGRLVLLFALPAFRPPEGAPFPARKTPAISQLTLFPFPNTHNPLFRQWIVVALKTPADEIIRGQGLDALVMVQSLAIGVQLFAPMACVGVLVLLPLHYRAAERRGGLIGSSDGLDRSALMRLTIASLPQGSALAW